jgi:hypothetical protein
LKPGDELLLALVNSVEAQFKYSVNNGAITITSNTGAGGAVTIPSTPDGLPVPSIGSNAFQNNNGLSCGDAGCSVAGGEVRGDSGLDCGDQNDSLPIFLTPSF